MIYSGEITTTPGTPVTLGSGLTTAQTRAAWVIIQWPAGNSGNMYVGGPTTASPFSDNTVAISGGNSITLPWIGAPGFYGLDKIFVDSDTAGDAVFLYAKG